MRSLSIMAKIWFSVGVFILGYMISVSLNQIQAGQTRTSLRVTSEALFPAAQQSQQAAAAFERELTEFRNAAVTQDATGVDRAAADGRDAIAALRSIAAIPAIAADRSKQASELGQSLEQLLTDSESVYRTAMAGTMTPETQESMRMLAQRSTQAKDALAKFQEQAAGDLHERLGTLEDQSVSQGTVGLILFLVTMVVAGSVVHLTIRRSITGPVVQVVSELSEGAAQISAAASQVATSSQSLAQGSSQQAASLEETSSATEEINSMARRNSGNTEAMTKLAAASQSEFEDTKQHMGDMVVAMDEINDASSKISKIIRTIDAIAFQTNILALNAAVEAARAGEAGMGFAVVADEVRTLAQRSAQAAKDTADLIEDSVAKSSGGKEKLRLVTDSMERIAGISAEINTLVNEVGNGSHEQTDGIGQISRALSQMESVTQGAAASAEQSAAAAEQLNAQSEALNELVARLSTVVGGGSPGGGERRNGS